MEHLVMPVPFSVAPVLTGAAIMSLESAYVNQVLMEKVVTALVLLCISAQTAPLSATVGRELAVTLSPVLAPEVHEVQ